LTGSFRTIFDKNGIDLDIEENVIPANVEMLGHPANKMVTRLVSWPIVYASRATA
jgi:hypothetical protein